MKNIPANIQKALKLLNSIAPSDVMKAYSSEGIAITVIDDIENIAYFDKDQKTVYVNDLFMRSVKETSNSREEANNKISYLLLHEFYHNVEGISSALPINSDFSEMADEYAKLVFKNNNIDYNPKDEIYVIS